MRSSSLLDIRLGSQMTPPLAPPKGTLTTAVFQVIHAARALTSSSVTAGGYSIPPFPRPPPAFCLPPGPAQTFPLPLPHLLGREASPTPPGGPQSSPKRATCL